MGRSVAIAIDTPLKKRMKAKATQTEAEREERRTEWLTPTTPNHEIEERPAAAVAAPVRHAVAAARQTVADEAAPRAPFPLAAPLAAVGQEATQAMARRMSTRAGTRSGDPFSISFEDISAIFD